MCNPYLKWINLVTACVVRFTPYLTHVGSNSSQGLQRKKQESSEKNDNSPIFKFMHNDGTFCSLGITFQIQDLTWQSQVDFMLILWVKGWELLVGVTAACGDWDTLCFSSVQCPPVTQRRLHILKRNFATNNPETK